MVQPPANRGGPAALAGQRRERGARWRSGSRCWDGRRPTWARRRKPNGWCCAWPGLTCCSRWSPRTTRHDLLNVDIGGGFPGLIAEMPVQSSRGRVALLPALPDRWRSGRVTDLHCRGQVVVSDLRWTPTTCTWSSDHLSGSIFPCVAVARPHFRAGGHGRCGRRRIGPGRPGPAQRAENRMTRRCTMMTVRPPVLSPCGSTLVSGSCDATVRPAAGSAARTPVCRHTPR